MEIGWHQDMEDGRWYYFDPGDGHMLTGWAEIDGNWYYFNPDATEQTWMYDDREGQWKYNTASTQRPLGSLFRNEGTPDGYAVDEYGRRINR